MKTLSLLALLTLAAIPAVAQKPKTPPTPPRSKPTVGVKGAGQVAGGVIRFGDLIALKSGFTYQILAARYSVDPPTIWPWSNQCGSSTGPISI